MITIVVPCCNEQEAIPHLYDRLSQAAQSWGEDYEVIAVDDGSIDNTLDLLEEIHRRDPRWKIISFSRNFGHQVAISAGMQYAKGDCVVLIDADLQDPPEQINNFLAEWRKSYEVVYAIREKRKESLFKRFCYKIFYRFLGKIANINIPLDSGDFCLMDKKVVDLLKQMPEKNRFVRGLRAWAGFRQIGLSYERGARIAGEPKYTLKKLVQLAIDGSFSFSIVPLRIVSLLGITFSGLSLIGAIFTLFQRIFSGFFAKLGLSPVPGYATTVIGIFLIGGMQLIALGVIGEYIGRIYEEVKQRPLWVVKKIAGIDL